MGKWVSGAVSNGHKTVPDTHFLLLFHFLPRFVFVVATFFGLPRGLAELLLFEGLRLAWAAFLPCSSSKVSGCPPSFFGSFFIFPLRISISRPSASNRNASSFASCSFCLSA